MKTTSNIPDVVFRDYDIRGVAGTEITADFANRLGKALGTMLRRNGNDETIYIGRDARLSSPELASALQAGLVSCGINVVDSGRDNHTRTQLRYPLITAAMPTAALW